MTVATDAVVAGQVGKKPAASWLARVANLLCPIVLVLYALKPLGQVKDPDAYWHIVAGQHLLKSGQFVLVDPFGAATEKVWILNQWLPEVLMAWAHATYGLPGVAWLLCVGSLLIGTAVYVACRRRASPLVTALVLALVFVALSGSLSPRPQLVTFALTAVTTSAWLVTREDGRPRWWLVPVTWLWACSHGMWFIGPVVGGLVVLGLLLEGRSPIREAARLALVPALSVFVAVFTPVGPRLFSSPFQVGGVTAYIREWQHPGLADPAVLAALVLLLLVAVDLLRRHRLPWTIVLLGVLALGLTVMWARTVGLGAVIVAPLAADGLQRLSGQPVETPASRERSTAVITGVMGLLVVGVAAPAVAVTPAIGPNQLDTALAALPSGTVVCNDQTDGGWLMLRHPGLRPTMDTRVELYSVAHIEAYLGFIAAQPGWQTYPSQVGCSYAVLPADAAVVAALQASNWRVADRAGGYILLNGSPIPAH